MEEDKNQNLTWTAPEYDHKPKSIDFLWGVGLLGVAGTIATIILGNYIFTIFIILSSLLLIIFSTRHPREATFEINKNGIFFGKELHKFKNINCFKIHDGDPYNRLIIETKKYFLPIYIIPLPHEYTEDVYNILSQIIPEEDIDETLSSKIMTRIGF